jgi:hypothetical protein
VKKKSSKAATKVAGRAGVKPASRRTKKGTTAKTYGKGTPAPSGKGAAATSVSVPWPWVSTNTSGKKSTLALFDSDGRFTSASKIKDGKVTSVVGGGVWDANADTFFVPFILLVELKCKTKPARPVVPETGSITVVVENGPSPPDPVEVIYVDD